MSSCFCKLERNSYAQSGVCQPRYEDLQATAPQLPKAVQPAKPSSSTGRGVKACNATPIMPLHASIIAHSQLLRNVCNYHAVVPL